MAAASARAYKRILIPTDGSPLSETAIRQGIVLAAALGASVTALTVFPAYHTPLADPILVPDSPEQYARDCEAAAARYLEVARTLAGAAGVPCECVHVADDQPYQAIIEAARARGCDLIVMASHGRRGVSALVLGSETTKVLTHSKIPVLVCR